RLPGNERSPDCVTLRPDVFALVVKTARVPVHDDPKRGGIEPRHDPAIEFRGASVDTDRMETFGIADGLRSMLQERGEQCAVVVSRAANNKFFGRVAPLFFYHFDIPSETSARHDNGAGAD